MNPDWPEIAFAVGHLLDAQLKATYSSQLWTPRMYHELSWRANKTWEAYETLEEDLAKYI